MATRRDELVVFGHCLHELGGLGEDPVLGIGMAGTCLDSLIEAVAGVRVVTSRTITPAS